MGKLISIVIPCYNEEKTINIICEAIQKTMEQVDDMEYELLLVNDGSSDDTLKLCKENHFPVISLPVNLGLSGGFQTGMKYAYRKNAETGRKKYKDKVLFFFKEFWQRSGNLCRIM